MSKVGVALAGGGARGAYQVGVIRAYVEQGGQVDVLAGTSIGALNGAVLLSAPSLVEGVERLERLWRSGAGPSLSVLRLFRAVARLSPLIDRFRWMLPDGALSWMEDGLYTTAELEKQLRTAVDLGRLSHGAPPFYVSVYPSEGGDVDILRLALAELGIWNTPDSHFLTLKGRSHKQIWQLLLASAALPIMFQNRGDWADGGLGGRHTSQGNTPVDPLVAEGCDVAILSHLNPDTRWTRDNYPALTAIEIMPNPPLDGDLLERDPHVLESWRQQGYRNAKSQLARVTRPIAARHVLAQSQGALAASETAREQAEARRREAMRRLDEPFD